ncbi:MAG: hypothetical protein NWE89_02195 [Candidatus Bathyarchaeota archaeon]|nr:hypothetical protein [Candidatus Bathyarchaeota archaeon]
MRLVALFSGGKDSTYVARLMELEGYDVPYLVSMRSKNPDSYMFHTVNIDITRLQAEAGGVPYIKAKTKGVKEEDLDDLKEILAPSDIDGVITGCIASRYQADRVTWRGRVIDEKAMVRTLKSWKIKAAALDVFEKEPLSRESLLCGMNNVILTPHLGASNLEGMQRMAV